MSIILDFKRTERKGKVIVKAITAGERRDKERSTDKIVIQSRDWKVPFLVIGFKNNLIHTSHRMLLMLPLPRAPEPLPTTTPGFSDPIHPKLFAIVIYVFIYYYTGDDTKNDRYNVLNYNTKQWRQSRCLFLCRCRIWLRNHIFVPRAWKTFCTFVGNNGCLE